MRRSIAVIACDKRAAFAQGSVATKQSILSLSPLDGLLRFARNDEMPEIEMTKTAFDKIKAGLEEVKAYLDALTKKRDDEPRPSQQK